MLRGKASGRPSPFQRRFYILNEIIWHSKKCRMPSKRSRPSAVDVESAAELFGLPSTATFGKWRDDESVTLTKTRHSGVQSSRDVPLFLDGERINVGKKAEISFVCEAVNVIVPKQN